MYYQTTNESEKRAPKTRDTPSFFLTSRPWKASLGQDGASSSAAARSVAATNRIDPRAFSCDRSTFVAIEEFAERAPPASRLAQANHPPLRTPVTKSLHPRPARWHGTTQLHEYPQVVVDTAPDRLSMLEAPKTLRWARKFAALAGGKKGHRARHPEHAR